VVEIIEGWWRSWGGWWSSQRGGEMKEGVVEIMGWWRGDGDHGEVVEIMGRVVELMEE